MIKYIIMPEGCRWREVEAATPELAYSIECSWYNPNHKIAIMDTETHTTVIFSRELDSNGNLITIRNGGINK